MNKPFKPSEELVSLNEELYTEYTIVELEQRLETDPLMVMAMLEGCQLTACQVPGSTLNYCESTLNTTEVCSDGGKLKENDNDVDICNPIM